MEGKVTISQDFEDAVARIVSHWHAIPSLFIGKNNETNNETIMNHLYCYTNDIKNNIVRLPSYY
jgi:hypothetical protein